MAFFYPYEAIPQQNVLYNSPTGAAAQQLTFSPAMHAPQYQQTGFESFPTRDLSHADINSLLEYQPRREPNTVNFAHMVPRCEISPLGTLNTDCFSNAQDENLRRIAVDSTSSSYMPRSPSLEHFRYVPMYPCTLYPEASSPDVTGQLPGEEVDHNLHDEDALGLLNSTMPSVHVGPAISDKDFLEYFGINSHQETFKPLTLSNPGPPSSTTTDTRFSLPSTPLDTSTAFLTSIDATVHRAVNPQHSRIQTFSTLSNHTDLNDNGSYAASSQFQTSTRLPYLHPLQSPNRLSTPELSSSTYTPSPVGNRLSLSISPTIAVRHAPYAIPRRPVNQQRVSTRQNVVPELHRPTFNQYSLAEDTSGRPPGSTGHSTRPVPSLASTSASTSRRPAANLPAQTSAAAILQDAFQEDSNSWRRLVLGNIMRAPFFNNDEIEPDDTGGNDPITMGYGRKGKSIYGVFIEEVRKGEWQCAFESGGLRCDDSPLFKRFERAVEHVRSHLNHRPFACPGECNTGPTCRKRFFAHQYLRDHRTRKEKAQCKICGRTVLLQNMNRHHNLRHPSP